MWCIRPLMFKTDLLICGIRCDALDQQSPIVTYCVCVCARGAQQPMSSSINMNVLRPLELSPISYTPLNSIKTIA